MNMQDKFAKEAAEEEKAAREAAEKAAAVTGPDFKRTK